MKETKHNKQGISLIVLVITIIIMIILATTVIISLSNSGIIGKANEAVNETNLKQVQTIATTIWVESQHPKLDSTTIKSKIIAAIGEDVASKYDIDVTETGVTVELATDSGDDGDDNGNINGDDDNIIDTTYYLYNGIELPNIDEVWTDKETYPYATITNYENGYVLWLTTQTVYADMHETEGIILGRCPTSTIIREYEFALGDTENYADGWLFVEEFVIGEGNTTSGWLDLLLFWASHDILNEDGTVYLEASEPKVYNTKINVDYSNTEGMTEVEWLVKISNLTPTVDELSSNSAVRMWYSDEDISYFTYSSLENLNEDLTVFVFNTSSGGTYPIYLVYQPTEIDGMVFNDTGIYAMPITLNSSGVFTLYYNSTSN